MLDIATVAGLVIGFVAVFGGGMIEGVHLSALMQPTAFMIVAGGTAGALLVSTPLDTVSLGAKLFKDLFLFNLNQMEELSKVILNYAEVARRESILALEKMIADAPHPFLQRALRCAVDGYDPETISDVMEAEMSITEERETNVAKMFEGAGGYAPTIGIIGAVLGLIHVMNGLARGGGTDELGSGIAVAFVATIYGLVIANLILIPFGSKLKTRAAYNKRLKQMMLAGVLGIVHGLNPRVIEERIKCYYAK
ncbi:MAG: flagellar motor protein [Oligoflexia bacterium]|nr:flagellar motor protein [Oligoflexia bacterium]MBF0365160.1 flagellar motor protein [Oligoflexia bacterium]